MGDGDELLIRRLSDKVGRNGGDKMSKAKILEIILRKDTDDERFELGCRNWGTANWGWDALKRVAQDEVEYPGCRILIRWDDYAQIEFVFPVDQNCRMTLQELVCETIRWEMKGDPIPAFDDLPEHRLLADCPLKEGQK